jgi:hypothetical protein
VQDERLVIDHGHDVGQILRGATDIDERLTIVLKHPKLG